MSNFILKENKAIGEKYYYLKHKSGLPIYVIPKNHKTGFAVFATKFGSQDSEFTLDGKRIRLPDGTAHFLEHKLFENEDGVDTFKRYAKVGASANAYTSLEKTVYLFSQSGDIKEALQILLDFVTKPYFTKETVQKEQGIIGQEIRMYEDHPNWRLYFNMLQALYCENTVRIDTAGTVQTIAEITPEVLYEAYHAFYDLHNMALCVCADISPEDVEAIADKVLQCKQECSVQRHYPTEPKQVRTPLAIQELEVSMPLFAIGIKDTDVPCKGKAFFKKQTEFEIILDLLFGKHTEFYTKLYEEGLINESFSYGYEGDINFGHCEISGIANDPDKVYKKVLERIDEIKKCGFDKSDFDMIKRALYASNLREFNSTENIANEFLKFIFCESDMLDLPEIISGVTLEDVSKRFNESFMKEYMVLSKIVPIS